MNVTTKISLFAARLMNAKPHLLKMVRSNFIHKSKFKNSYPVALRIKAVVCNRSRNRRSGAGAIMNKKFASFSFYNISRFTDFT